MAITVHHMLLVLLRRGHTQADLARLTGVHHSQISRWISGKPPRYADATLTLQQLYSASNAAQTTKSGK